MTKNEAKRIHRITMRAGAIALTALLGGGLAAGCGGDDVSEVVSYTDSAGRSCTVDLWDITGQATCDADPSALVTCEAPREPVFVLSDDYDFETMIYTRRSCTACMDAEAHETYIADCATVECEADIDCLNSESSLRQYRCESGLCLYREE